MNCGTEMYFINDFILQEPVSYITLNTIHVDLVPLSARAVIGARPVAAWRHPCF